MDAERFVDLIRQVVMKSAVQDAISSIQSPPGCSPDSQLKRLSTWFNGLSDEDRQNVTAVAQDAAHAAVFGLFCVLDGVRPIEEFEAGGFLELWYKKAGEAVLISSSGGETSEPPLHELPLRDSETAS